MSQSATDFRPIGDVVAAGEGSEGPQGVKARTPREIFWSRFKEDKVAIFGGLMIVIVVVLGLAAPLFAGLVDHPFDHQYRGRGDEPLMLNEFGTPLPPNKDFWFGADHLGRDLFVRVLYGARVSLKVALLATGFELLVGVFLGILAGFKGGWVDTIISRAIDLILSIPFLLLGISLGIVLSPSAGLVVFIIAFFGWPYIARVVRGQTLSLREYQFVEASYSVGASPMWIMFKEILPNLIAPIIIYATLIIPINVVAEASLSFLGVGVQEPNASWGKMLEVATKYVLFGKWWLMLYPGLFLFVTVLGFNMLGDGLRDALDPKTAAK